MGSKALVRLVIVLAAVVVLALIVKLTGPGTVESVSGSGNEREKVFPEFPASFAKIRIKTTDDEVNLVKGKDAWLVAERGDHPANELEIVEFARKVWDLKVIQAPEIGASQFSRLKLIDPDKGASDQTATVVSFQNAEGKELASLWLGKFYERDEGRPSPMGGSSTTKVGRYVKPGGEEVVFLVDETFSNIEPDPAGWLNEDFFNVEKIKTLAINSTPREDETDAWTDADNWKLTRAEVTGDFTLAGATEEEELDPTKVSSMKSAFSSPKFDDVVVGDEAKENQPDRTAYTIETFDGFTYVVKASKKNDTGELYLTYEVDGKFEDKRKPGEEESDEEKKTLDEAFAENLKTLREKLAKEKAIAGKVYKVRGYVIDSITKKRSEILVGEENPGGATSAVPGLPNIPGLPSGLPPGTIQLPKDGGGVPLNFQPAPADPAPKPKPVPDGDAPGPGDKPKKGKGGKGKSKADANPEEAPESKPGAAPKPDAGKPAPEPESKTEPEKKTSPDSPAQPEKTEESTPAPKPDSEKPAEAKPSTDEAPATPDKPEASASEEGSDS